MALVEQSKCAAFGQICPTIADVTFLGWWFATRLHQLARPGPCAYCDFLTNPLVYYRANFDFAVFKNNNAAGLGVVIRDSCCEIMGAMSVRVPLPQTVTEVEVLACRHAVSFAIELGLHEVIFDGDSAVVIQAINGRLSSPSLYAILWMTSPIKLLSGVL